jgi:hypothetical protein
MACIQTILIPTDFRVAFGSGAGIGAMSITCGRCPRTKHILAKNNRSYSRRLTPLADDLQEFLIITEIGQIVVIAVRI